MIIQHVLKGISGISRRDALRILDEGITCNWWRKADPLPEHEIAERLTERNLEWHQNRYADPDPLERGERFGEHTPFISVTAGTIERDSLRRRHLLHPAKEIALQFATNQWRRDGYVFHCYVFLLGRKSLPHRAFSEELRELNIYTRFSLFQPEGEIAAKIVIPAIQIEKCEAFTLSGIKSDLALKRFPKPSETIPNPKYTTPDDISNLRRFLVDP